MLRRLVGARRVGLAAAAVGVSAGGCALSSSSHVAHLTSCESAPRAPQRTSANPNAQRTSGQRFLGKTVLITGAGGQLGREGAIFFASQGANVVAVDASAPALHETLRSVRESTPHASVIAAVCDVRCEESVEAAVARAVDAFGKIDCLWNNAGVQGAMLPLLQYPADDFKTVLDVNVLGSFLMLKAVAASMSTTGGGSIVNTSSVAALRGTPTMSAYVASKAAVIGMTLTAAKDLAPCGVRYLVFLHPDAHFSHMSHTPFPHISECHSSFGAESTRSPQLSTHFSHISQPISPISQNVILFLEQSQRDLPSTHRSWSDVGSSE